MSGKEGLYKLITNAWNVAKQTFEYDLNNADDFDRMRTYVSHEIEEYEKDTKEYLVFRKLMEALDYYHELEWREKNEDSIR